MGQSVTICPGVTLSTSYGPASCFGQPRTVSLSVSGSNYQPLFDWNDNNTNFTLASKTLVPGTYQVKVWIPYQPGCPTDVAPYLHSVQVTQPSKVEANANIKSMLTCAVSELPNGPDGVLEVIPTGGTNVFQYRVDWDYNPTSPSFIQGDLEREATSPGTYFVAVRDDNNCVDIDTIAMPPTPSLGFGVFSASNSCNINGGGFTLQASNVQATHAPVIFSLLNPSDHSDTLATQVSSTSPHNATFLGLANGTYFAAVSDQAGCSTGGNYGISIAGQMNVSIQRIEKVKCLNASDGDVTVHRTGGSGPWTITFLKPDGSTFHTRNSSMGNNVHAFREMFPAGNFSVFIKDANGCYSDTVPFTVGDTLSGMNVSPLTLNKQIFGYCHNGGNYANAEVKLSASGGVPPYTYGVVQGYHNNNGQLWPDFSATGVWHAQNGFGEFYHLPNTGNQRWTLGVIDAVGCDVGFREVIPILPPMVLSSSSISSVDCYSNATGSIVTSIIGGEGQMDYTLSPGSITNSTGSFFNLVAGYYTIQATDTNGCYSNQLGVDVIQPNKLEAEIISHTDPSCNPGTGRVTYQIRGGTINYSVFIDGTLANTISNITSSNQWSTGGLTQGTHTFKVVDGQGCSTVDTTFIITGPPSPGAPPNSGTTLTVTNPPASTNVDCYGNSTGEISLAISGGWPALGGYTIEVDKIISYIDRNGIARSTSNRIKTTNNPLITGLDAGSYRLAISDSYGCRRVVSANITEPTLIQPIFNGISGNCGGGASTTTSSVSGGVNLLDIVGGVPEYSYIVNGGPIQTLRPNFFPNLTLSSLFMEITDATGCKVYFP